MSRLTNGWGKNIKKRYWEVYASAGLDYFDHWMPLPEAPQQKSDDGPDFMAMNDFAFHKNGNVYYHHGMAPFDQWTLVDPHTAVDAMEAFEKYCGYKYKTRQSSNG